MDPCGGHPLGHLFRLGAAFEAPPELRLLDRPLHPHARGTLLRMEEDGHGAEPLKVWQRSVRGVLSLYASSQMPYRGDIGDVWCISVLEASFRFEKRADDKNRRPSEITCWLAVET